MANSRYFFRDLDNGGNRGEMFFQPAGIVLEIVGDEKAPSYSGKDVSVKYLDPFTGIVEYQWRAFNEIELFKVVEPSEEHWEYEYTKKVLEAIENRFQTAPQE